MKIKNLIASLKSKFVLVFGKNKKLWSFVLIGIMLVAVCVFLLPNDSKKEDSQKIDTSFNLASKEYKEALELKLKQILLAVDEVESASVMVVCDESEKYVYLKNITETSSGAGEGSSKTTSEEVVYEKSGSNSAPILVSKVMPKIVGVLIVINSVSPSTKLAITNSVASVLNIDESRISILQGR